MRRVLSVLAILISPPFAFLLGIAGAVVLWFALGEANLPGWARLGLSLMAVTALPGLWFIALPIIFARQGATRLGSPEFQAWEDRRMNLWETHRVELERLGHQRIERVIASGEAATAADVTITLVAVALGAHGGDITLIQTAGQEPDNRDLSLAELVTDLTDDVGTRYAVVNAPVEMSVTGARTHVMFVPAVPESASELRLSVEKILEVPDTEPIRGPWRFRVPIGPNG